MVSWYWNVSILDFIAAKRDGDGGRANRMYHIAIEVHFELRHTKTVMRQSQDETWSSVDQCDMRRYVLFYCIFVFCLGMKNKNAYFD